AKAPKRTISLACFGHKAKPKSPELAVSRAEQCRQIGSAIANARMTQNLSLEQVHVRTLIPVCHLRALEAGNLDELPEDVYLRGFIRQIGNVLGLNGVKLAASLSEAHSSVVPSWYRAPKSSLRIGMQVSPVHLYLGYTALVAGTVGGLSLMSDYHAMNASIQPDLPDAANPSTRDLENTQIKATTSEQAAANVVPPETMNN
ncbi:MAG: helix-turn-helix domain-containing protein, partial [Jaaginema sp. PMC 1078.18]|nr:helix-turn-helix domain-containing protein [Jaaginema sp. PMC 1078.18]